MDRLTEWRDGHGSLVKGDGYTKLARYEDTGLEPEEIEEIQRTLKNVKYDQILELNKALDTRTECSLVILPCKFGTKIWEAGPGGIVRQCMVIFVSAQDGIRRRTLVECNPFTRFVWEDDFGKDFFWTKEEAEAELERRRKNETTDL